MKTLSVLLFVAMLVSVSFTSCRSRGGPAQRVGREMDNAVWHAGRGISKAGQAIQRAAN
jgi:predicted small secreted protein